MRYFDNSAAFEDAVQDAPKYGSTKTGAVSVLPRFEGIGELPQAVTRPQDADVVVYSYGTPIGWCVAGTWTVPNVQYSITTTKHQDHLIRVAGRKRDRLVTMNVVPTEQDAAEGWHVQTGWYGARLHRRGAGRSPFGPRLGW